MLSWLVPATVGATAGVDGVSAVGVAEASVPGADGVFGTSAGSFTAVLSLCLPSSLVGLPVLSPTFLISGYSGSSS
ncbi:hypothetical protein AZJ70_12190 [Streptococcus pneumoniae]|uniref:Uncharacterized protein n=1 Tax=Streptococcus pneumoniae TaxID=1313 RepID=A0A558ZSY3_STREE|nr:hypothetical protein AZJ70_12190 [Streptococcus pneumoniae]